MRNMSEDTISHDLHLDDLRLEDLQAYVEETGWRDVKYPSDRLLVFEGPENDDGNPLLLSLPTRRGFRDTDDRLLDAINLLAAVEQTSPNTILEKIRSRDRDTMHLRLHLPSNNLPSVEAISFIMSGWRDLITFSACMEQELKPYFEEPIPIGKQQAEHFWFGHTFQGSFGLTIESVVAEPPLGNLPSSLGVEDHIFLPIERRVIERITRGLLFAQEAERMGSYRIISDNFTLGLNANMCNALLEVLNGIQDAEMEITVTWSPRWKPSDDILSSDSILLQRNISQYVKGAARALKNTTRETQKAAQIQDVLVFGPIIEMNSDDVDHRTITISWQERQERVIIPLELEDYQRACDAHRDGQPISVRGRLIKKGRSQRSWTLINPYDFMVK